MLQFCLCFLTAYCFFTFWHNQYILLLYVVSTGHVHYETPSVDGVSFSTVVSLKTAGNKCRVGWLAREDQV